MREYSSEDDYMIPLKITLFRFKYLTRFLSLDSNPSQPCLWRARSTAVRKFGPARNALLDYPRSRRFQEHGPRMSNIPGRNLSTQN